MSEGRVLYRTCLLTFELFGLMSRGRSHIRRPVKLSVLGGLASSGDDSRVGFVG